MKKVKADY